MPERVEIPRAHAERVRTRQGRFLSYVYLPLMGIGIASLVYININFGLQVGKVQSDTRLLQRATYATCEATNAARTESNRDLREPLKEAVTLAAGNPTDRAASEALADRLEALEATANPVDRQILSVLVTAFEGNPKLSQAYGKLAKDIKLEGLLDCNGLSTGNA